MQLDYVIAKPFNSTIRRFKIGDPIAETEDISPHTFDDLKRRHWIVSDATKTGAAAIKEGDKIDAAEAEAKALATQAGLQQQWYAESQTGAVPHDRWAIQSQDDGVFGAVVHQEVGRVFGVEVPGEDSIRFYHADAVDLVARTVSGKYSDDPAAVRPRRR